MTRKKTQRRAKTARPGKKPAANKPAVRRRSRPTPAAAKTDTIAPLVTASARELTLPIDQAWRAGVEHNLRLILTHAALVDQFLLPDEIEPAPVFRA